MSDEADLINILIGDMPAFARNYLFGGMRYNITDQVNISAFSNENFVDQSIMLLPAAGYDVSENINIEFSAQVGLGNPRRSEYGGIYPHFILTVNVYF